MPRDITLRLGDPSAFGVGIPSALSVASLSLNLFEGLRDDCTYSLSSRLHSRIMPITWMKQNLLLGEDVLDRVLQDPGVVAQSDVLQHLGRAQQQRRRVGHVLACLGQMIHIVTLTQGWGSYF